MRGKSGSLWTQKRHVNSAPKGDPEATSRRPRHVPAGSYLLIIIIVLVVGGGGGDKGAVLHKRVSSDSAATCKGTHNGVRGGLEGARRAGEQLGLTADRLHEVGDLAGATQRGRGGGAGSRRLGPKGPE